MPTQDPAPFGSTRYIILNSYAEWTALSALRQGPRRFRKREKIYRAIRAAGLGTSPVLRFELGRIERKEFDAWHSNTIECLISQNPELDKQVGWAAKIINVYLKTFAYVGDGGRPGLRACLHPPIDGGLWKGVRRSFGDRKNIISNTHCVETIEAIATHKIYRRILCGLRRIAEEKQWDLIEVESLWEGTKIDGASGVEATRRTSIA